MLHFVRILPFVILVQVFCLLAEKNMIMANEHTATVKATNVNVREGPDLTFNVIGKVNENEQYHVIERNRDWVQLKLKENQKGWVASWLVSLNETESSITNTTTVVNATILNVRKESSLNANIIGKLQQGEEVIVEAKQSNWTKVKFNNSSGWVANEFLTNKDNTKPEVIIINDGTNIRNRPTTNSDIVIRANDGDHFEIIGTEGDWYKIKIPSTNETAYIANWVVKTNDVNKHRESSFFNKTIVIDPGHGGRDPGTNGVDGTIEKDITLDTGLQIATLLRDQGANVILTRRDDQYISLQDRVHISNHNDVDAFISIHYDSVPNPQVNGLTSFYSNKTKDQALASSIHKQLLTETNLHDRKVQEADYFVIKENIQPSVLLELGFLSHKQEELTVNTDYFQEKATKAIVEGLSDYFDNLATE